ncbi:LptF/LptG family permease [Haloferula sp. BvORR071]|uniref:LptF/LptG family permease n=1 Tax=Haloferula sp. BvORR071 TaxID=1396141 RepID=UPI00054DBD98|nr:LptF/LptG family permease [Haloferula sp. BvORR071]
MRLSDRYIGRQVLASTVFAILVLSTILVMGSIFQKIRPLLVDAGARLSVIAELVVASIPASLIYTIPWAFLSAILLVFGRMSSDQELTGFRVAGISLARLSAPVFAIAGALSALCLWLNVTIAPKSNNEVDYIFVRAFFTDPLSMLRAAAETDGLARLDETAKGVRVYLGESNEKGSYIKNLHLFKVAEKKRKDPKDPNSPFIYTPPVYVHAQSAQTEADLVKRQFNFRLFDAYLETTEKDKEDGTKGAVKMIVASEAVPAVIPFEMKPPKPKANTMTNRQIREYLATDPKLAKNEALSRRLQISRFWSEEQRRYASSFACLAFAFVGIPLGIKARRKDTSTGLVLSLLIGAAYFVCSMSGGTTKAAVLAGLWGPNIACVLIGLYLLRRARFR